VDLTNWALDNTERKSRVVRSGYGVNIMPHWEELYAKYDRMKAELQEWEEQGTGDAAIVLCGFGLVGRICRSVAQKARTKGIPVGVIRPKMISPFPVKAFAPFKNGGKYFLTVEMNYGQMIDDVTVALGDGGRSRFFRNRYGSLPRMGEILAAVEKLWEEIK
jgi:pyruvate/2-oxoacid:ferredoxin oxidoreductase alpha subunit